ncbi:MAG: hypothetical protein ACLT8E_11855 [Akkermansia sp.]
MIQDRVRLAEDQRERRLEALNAMRLRRRGPCDSPVDGIYRLPWPRGDWHPLMEPRPGLFSFHPPGGMPEWRLWQCDHH